MTKQDNILHKSWELPNTEAAVQGVCQEILNVVTAQGFEEDTIFGIHLSLEEAFTNADRSH